MSGTQVSSWGSPNILYKALSGEGVREQQALDDTHVNALLAQQTTQANLNTLDLEMIARASAYLNTLPEDQRATAYPGIVSQLQQSGFAKNAPSIYPGHERIAQLAAMGTPSKELMEIGEGRAWANAQRPVAAAPAPGAAPAAGGGFSTDRETARRQIVAQESGGDPTALNYVARQDPSAYARGATASGKYQFVNSTWREGMQLAGLDPAQYPTAREAPEAVQDRVFDAVYGKYGSKPWEKGSRDWVRDEQGQYQLATVRPTPGAPGGPPAGTPAPYQTASLVPVPPPTGGTGAPAVPVTPAIPGGQGLVRNPDGTVGTPNAGGLATPGTTAAAGGSPGAPAVPAPPATAPAAAAPPFTPPKPVNANGLTTDQQRSMDALLPSAARTREGRANWTAKVEQLKQQNETEQRQYERDVNTWQNQQQTAARAARGEERQEDTAARTAANEAERIRIAQQAEQRAQKEFDQKMVEANRPYPGNTPEAADMNILITGSQPGGDPNTVEYRNAYTRQAWKESSTGNTIARDMSMFKSPGGDGGAVKPPTVTPGSSQQFQQADKLRDEFQKLTADFRVVQNSYENMRQSAEKPSGAGDMSLLYSYVRLLDPTSVVRESEFATAAASGSFGERVQGAVGRVLSGERLPDSLRQDFMREARNLYNTQLRNHNQIADQYTNLAKQNGLNPANIVTRFDRAQPESEPVPPPEQRKAGTVYPTPKGPMKWTGTGWLPAGE